LLTIKPGAVVYQAKVTLSGILPEIWRRLLLPGNTKLEQVHESIQTVFGWSNSHLHEFEIAGQRYGDPDNPPHGDFISERATKCKLKFLNLKPGDKFIYRYDFGDDWTHEIEIEDVLPPDPNGYYPDCIAGARACPPEDCGGIPGYQNFLEAICDASHPDHHQLLKWIGGDFDPERFDRNEARKGILIMMTIS
jgi:hypothetical protein